MCPTEWLEVARVLPRLRGLWIELALYPRTLAYALFRPRVFTAKVLQTRAGRSAPAYMSPMAFFLLNAAIGLALANDWKSTGDLGISLVALAAGNAFLIAVLSLTSGMPRRRHHESLLNVLLYGSAYYVPVGVAIWIGIGPAVGPQALAISATGSRWPSGAPGVLIAASLAVILLLIAFWSALLARGLQAMRRRQGVTFRGACWNVGLALFLLACIESAIQIASVSRTFLPLAETVSAVYRAGHGEPTARDAPYYEATETLVRNTGRCFDCTTAERYELQQTAALLLMVRIETSAQPPSDQGLKESRGADAFFARAKGSRRSPAAFEALLKSEVTEWSKRGDGVIRWPQVASQLASDARELSRLRKLPGFVGGHGSFEETGGGFGIGVVVSGFYLSPLPQGGPWPPAPEWIMTLTRQLPSGRRVTTYLSSVGNPMEKALTKADTTALWYAASGRR